MQKIDDMLSKPFSLWIISLVAAFGLWLYVGGKEDAIEKSRMVACNLEFVNLAPQLEIKSLVHEVWVDAYGPENEIDKIDGTNITCEVDTRGLTAGRYRLSVRATIPKGLRLREIRPSQVDVELLRYADRLVPVEIALPKDMPEGTYLDSVEITPKEVTIKGIERDLARIGGAKLSPTVEELRSGKELLLAPTIEQSEPFDEKVNVEPQQVRIKAVLASGNPKRMIPVHARISGTPFGDYAVQTVTIDPAEVMVEGAKAALDRLKAIDTETIDISDISDSKSMVVPLRSPQDRNLKILGENNVRVSIGLQPVSATKEISGIPVAVEGGVKEAWTVSPPIVAVTVEGLPSKINSVDSIDLSAFVNVENVFSKQVALPVRVRLGSDAFKVTKIDPATVSLNREVF